MFSKIKTRFYRSLFFCKFQTPETISVIVRFVCMAEFIRNFIRVIKLETFVDMITTYIFTFSFLVFSLPCFFYFRLILFFVNTVNIY